MTVNIYGFHLFVCFVFLRSFLFLVLARLRFSFPPNSIYRHYVMVAILDLVLIVDEAKLGWHDFDDVGS